MPPHSKEFVSDGWRDWCSESCCYTTPAAAVNADYLDIIAEIIPCVFVSHTFLVFHAWHFSSPPADIKICKWEQMYEKRALRVQKWTVEKKRSHRFLETPFGPLLVICYKFSLSNFLLYCGKYANWSGKNAPKYMQQQSELLISNPSLFTWQIVSQEMTSEV